MILIQDLINVLVVTILGGIVWWMYKQNKINKHVTSAFDTVHRIFILSHKRVKK